MWALISWFADQIGPVCSPSSQDPETSQCSALSGWNWGKASYSFLLPPYISILVSRGKGWELGVLVWYLNQFGVGSSIITTMGLVVYKCCQFHNYAFDVHPESKCACKIQICTEYVHVYIDWCTIIGSHGQKWWCKFDFWYLSFKHSNSDHCTSTSQLHFDVQLNNKAHYHLLVV